MGHYCRICGLEWANEKFSGKGHKIHVCIDCMRLPKEDRQAVKDEQESWSYLSQSNISTKNLSHLEKIRVQQNEGPPSWPNSCRRLARSTLRKGTGFAFWHE